MRALNRECYHLLQCRDSLVAAHQVQSERQCGGVDPDQADVVSGVASHLSERASTFRSDEKFIDFYAIMAGLESGWRNFRRFRFTTHDNGFMEYGQQGNGLRLLLMMKIKITFRTTALIISWLYVIWVSSLRAEVSARIISFSDIKPEGVPLQQSWGAIGNDEYGNIYVLFSDNAKLAGLGTETENCYIFKYQSNTGMKKYLGNFRQSLIDADNYPDLTESIPKGHSPIVSYGKYMFTGSFPSHEPSVTDPRIYRGSHLFAIHKIKGTIEDRASDQPDGVIQSNQGIIFVSKAIDLGYIVALSTPEMDVIYYDPLKHVITRIVQGHQDFYGTRAPRSVVIANNGDVYLSPHKGDYSVYKYVYTNDSWDIIQADVPKNLGPWNGFANTVDGKLSYISTVNGGLIQINTETDKIKFIDRLIDDNSISAVRSIALSPDEKKVFYIPVCNWEKRFLPYDHKVYEYSLVTGERTMILNLDEGWNVNQPTMLAGSDAWDKSGNFYVSRFYNFANNSVSGGDGDLVQIDVSDRIDWHVARKHQRETMKKHKLRSPIKINRVTKQHNQGR